MTDDNDIALRALFQDAEHEEAQSVASSPSNVAFTEGVMARVVDIQAMHDAVFNTLFIAGSVTVLVVALVFWPSLGPALGNAFAQSTALSTAQTTAQSTAMTGLSGQAVGFIALAIFSGLGWAIAVRD